MRFIYLVIASFMLAGMVSCRNPEIQEDLTGKWQCGLVGGHGSWFKLDPEVDFFSDGTLKTTNRRPAVYTGPAEELNHNYFVLASYQKGTWRIDNGNLIINCQNNKSQIELHFEILPDQLKLKNSPLFNWQMRRIR